MRGTVVALAIAAVTVVASATHGAPPELRARVIAGASYLRGADESRSDIALRRAELGLRFAFGPHLALDAQVDAVRSASPTSLFGVDGNALVLALSRAYGEVGVELGAGGAVGRLEARMGLVPDPVADVVESVYQRRVVADVLAESGGFHWRSDLGLTVLWSGFDERVAATVALTTGEGAREVELDDDKDVLVLVHGDPWVGRLFGGPARVRLAAGYRHGTRGIGSVRDDRVFGLVALASPTLSLGLEGHLALGYDARADRQVRGLGAWLEVAPLEVLALAVRVDWLTLDTHVPDSDRVVAVAGVVTDLAAAFSVSDAAFRVFVGWRGERVGGSAATVTGIQSSSDSDALVLVLEVRAGPP